MSEPASETIRLTIDGVEVAVPKGTTVLKAAETAGIVVPHYCYHPGIPTRPAQCRMCLVEIEGQPKLQPSCVMTAGDGMNVVTQSEAAREARRSVIEFLLLNHPVDCPICDAAGQCMLQDYAYETGQLESRFQEAKLVLGRDRIADDILYFADRCILCTRCVRFMRDVAGDEALIVAQRGHKAYIDTFPGKDLDNEFRGNIVDVCPVGALVHEDFLFKARAWDMDSAPGVCPGCSNGCNIEIGAKENQVVRIKPRYNAEVNSYWMCDYGRKHLVMANRGARIDLPLIRRNGELEAVHWGEALTWLSERMPEGDGVAVVSPFESTESIAAFRALLARIGISGGGYRLARGDEAQLAGFPKLKLRAERAPNATAAELFGFREVESLPSIAAGATVIVAGDRLDDLPADFAGDAGFFAYLGSHLSEAARNADVILPITTFLEMEGTFINHEGRLQRFRQALVPPGVARPAWMVIRRLLSLLGDGADVLEAEAAFERAATETPGLAGIAWSAIGPKGVLVRTDGAAAPSAR
ncbi:MAG: molybdopterin-dependent oxidoreductase [marine benthic group bacterium]|jgi:NADH-quinone oxidoreductase subunit G|nr:molybdopterin-dependent oxidoreductase [Gemmatimonadota bacterium]MCL7937529.1 molybdopterin-dependent oxidoreductase [Gemmatimonadota bacterium]MCL7967944.1 molybdopterin-dependent oxidoreductase [Gemmatimonadota bacterium]MCL7969349.1 molybdopterin-dependent oxidoreductase [Gemmatimonadota bacterium]MCL7984751.1 molybdopterin-dependent oxidoreductase [Gemmatimonadota bacterium]